MKTGVALWRYVKWICIHLYFANLDRDNNIFGQDVALEIPLQHGSVYLNKTTL